MFSNVYKEVVGIRRAFTTTDGKQFVIGDIRGEQWVWHFINALREGRTYKLPETFTNYQSAAHYVTSNEIAALPPCTATLAARSPCSSMFVTTEGKWLGIGDPGSGARVSHFIWTLKDGETCNFRTRFGSLSRRRIMRQRRKSRRCRRAARPWCMPGSEGVFKGGDGKGFFIGGEHSGTEVDRFLRTLEEDKTYEFPDVFVSYQKPKK